MPLILSGNVASATASTGYTVDNSCRFNDDDDARISLTLGTATNIDIWTMSCWVKRCTLGANSSIFTCYGNASAQKGTIRFDSTDKISAYLLYDGGWKSFTTNEVFRDVSAWYHIVVAVDTTQAVATNRMKVYINGTQITSFATYNAMDQSADTWFNAAVEHQIGSLIDETEDGDMYLSEFVFIDGTQYAASDFGEFDSNTPTVFKPIDVSGLTFGDNGAYLSFSDSADLGADSSGNSNDFTATNLAATDQATDTPTNNFATLNILDGTQGNSTFSEGNCKIAFSSGDYMWARSTTGMSSGKWYAEFKNVTSQEHSYVAICVDGADDTSTYIGGGGGAAAGVNDEFEWGYKTSSGGVWNDASEASYGDTYTDGDIISVALDLDNNKLYFAKNGTWQDSGDPTSGATGTGAVSITAPASTSTGFYFFAVVDGTSASAGGFEANFGGCPAFTVSSGNADGDGYGNFEYAVPSGYYALCTKNLGAYGG